MTELNIVIILIAATVVLAISFIVHHLRQGRYDFWRLVAKNPDIAYDLFMDQSCWHVFTGRSDIGYRMALPPGEWDGPFKLCVPKLGGTIVTIYGKVPDYQTSQKEFIQRIIYPQSTTFLHIISKVLLHHHDFHKHDDIIKYLFPLSITDTTDDLDMKLLDITMPLPIGFNQRTYKFKDSINWVGVIDAVFYSERLVNFRCQLILHGLNKKQINEYAKIKLLPVISKIIGTDKFGFNAATKSYYHDYNNEFIVAFNISPEIHSVSVYLMDKAFA